MKCIESPISKAERKRRESLRDFYLFEPEKLWEILIEHGLFTPINDTSQMVMRNWALKHLEDIGILDEAKLKKALLTLLEMDIVDTSQTEKAVDPYEIPQE